MIKEKYVEEAYRVSDHVLEFLLSSRNQGFTTLSIEGAKNYDKPFYVIGIDMSQTEILMKMLKDNKNAIPLALSQVFPQKYIGRHYPAFIDNGALITILKGYSRSLDDIYLNIDKHNDELYQYEVYLGYHDNKFFSSKYLYNEQIKNISLFDRIFKYKKTVEKLYNNIFIIERPYKFKHFKHFNLKKEQDGPFKSTFRKTY